MTTTDWNFGRIFAANAAKAPDRPAQIHGDAVQSWGEFHERANSLAADLVASGIEPGSKVACYLHNSAEYLETMFGSFLAGCAPVNTNYRYTADELVYLFDNADAEAVVFHGTFASVIEPIRARLDKVRRWYMVRDEVGEVPGWAVDYEAVVSAPVAHLDTSGLDGDGQLLLYTGGTTGMPKGVIWRHDDLYNVMGAGGVAVLGTVAATDMDDLLSRLDPAVPGLRALVACPMMHGTGQFISLNTLAGGGCVVTMQNRSFDPAGLWRLAQDSASNVMVIVGQAFAGPMLEVLDADPGAFDLSSLFLITSSGVMWSKENKKGILEHIPHAILFDSLGSSEAVGMGASYSSKDAPVDTAKFTLGPTCAVFTEDGRRVEPGSGEEGMVAIGGHIPLGYYKDEVKTAQTFRVFEGQRWSVPGDFATVEADGSITLLGRGSVCINTGGEKVFPEEVEEAMKTHPAVRDAVAVGVPDARFGEAICAVLEPDPGAQPPDLDEIAGHVRSRLAGYKVPRHVVVVDTIGRAPNGKVDYKRLRSHAADALGL
jgi:fatty-acyl-CoA synthase